MSAPLFSIITITYNAADALRRTIDSVNAQTCAEVEHILIDGGSTDGSLALIAERAKRAPRWLSERDRGISDAFNKGTRLARGAFVCYLNAGDVFASPTVLERVAEQMALAPAGAPAVYFGDFISSDGGVERRHRASAEPGDFEWDNPINHQSAFVPRGVALAFPYDERLTLGMDFDFWLRVLPGTPFRRLSFPVAVFEMGGRSSAPAWEAHSAVMHRVLWHINRGTRLTTGDLGMLVARIARLKVNHLVRRLLGRRLALAWRAAKSRRLDRMPPAAPVRNLKECTES
jgi:glycosyltransferase involved in cell wall biosynthesis